MSDSTHLRLLYVVIAVLVGCVLCVLAATIASSTSCDDSDPCWQEPHPLRSMYLPLVGWGDAQD